MKTRLWVWAGVGFAGLLIYLIGYRWPGPPEQEKDYERHQGKKPDHRGRRMRPAHRGRDHGVLVGARPRPCGYGLPDRGHNKYYRERADMMYGRLESEIGTANVLLATRVILQERG
jgi:hypothetical protein